MQKKCSNNLLILFAKAPLPGQVKTRMQPPLSAQQAVTLYWAMGRDLVAQLSGSGQYDFCVYYSPAEAREAVARWLGKGLAFYPQSSGNLGERMATAFGETLQRYRRVVIIGCDLPTLTAQTVQQAFAALDEADVVLGPTEDGGYYLIGLKQVQPVLFQNIDWSTDAVFKQTLARARQAGLKVSLLPCERDLDTFADLEAFWVRCQKKAAASNHFPEGHVTKIIRELLGKPAAKPTP
ncbi:MAG: glycosyltransferase [Calditrichaeota bacterium]|nr:MAG: glycosyltransferase [Calditrichota bacterium]